MISWTLQPSAWPRSVASEPYAVCSAGPSSWGATAKRTGLCGQLAADAAAELVASAEVVAAADEVAAAAAELLVELLVELDPQPAAPSAANSSRETAAFFMS